MKLRSRAVATLGAIPMLLAFGTGIVHASGTYSAGFCYDAADNQVVIEQVWSGMTVDEVNGGIGGKKGGFGFDNVLVTPTTSGDETDSLLADRHATTVGGAVLYQGVMLGSQSINKPHGGWAKLPAC
jgi:hypothetical protein